MSFQAYSTLAAGYRGVTWYNYYGPGYHYTAIDSAGKKSLTWLYLRQVNTEIAGLAPVLSHLSSTGVYFAPPGPVENLPLLPGNVVASVACETPIMVGEFMDQAGIAYAMVVNLSLERSAKFTLTTRDSTARIQIVSALDGSLSGFDGKAGCWLVAGGGVLLKLGR